MDSAIFLRGLIVLLTAQIIRNEHPGVRATAPSAVNMFQPHLAGGPVFTPPRKQRKTALGSNPAFALGLVLLDAY